MFGEQGTCNPDRLTPCSLSSAVPHLQVGMGFLLRFLSKPEVGSTHLSSYQEVMPREMIYVVDAAGKRNPRNKPFRNIGLG